MTTPHLTRYIDPPTSNFPLDSITCALVANTDWPDLFYGGHSPMCDCEAWGGMLSQRSAYLLLRTTRRMFSATVEIASLAAHVGMLPTGVNETGQFEGQIAVTGTSLASALGVPPCVGAFLDTLDPQERAQWVGGYSESFLTIALALIGADLPVLATTADHVAWTQISRLACDFFTAGDDWHASDGYTTLDEYYEIEEGDLDIDAGDADAAEADMMSLMYEIAGDDSVRALYDPACDGIENLDPPEQADFSPHRLHPSEWFIVADPDLPDFAPPIGYADVDFDDMADVGAAATHYLLTRFGDTMADATLGEAVDDVTLYGVKVEVFHDDLIDGATLVAVVMARPEGSSTNAAVVLFISFADNPESFHAVGCDQILHFLK